MCVFSPIIFAIFLTPVQHIFNKYPDVNYNLYADDIELHFNIDSTDQLQNCLTDLHNWLTTNYILLHSTKTELINISIDKITYIHTYIHTYTHTYIHIYIHTYIYIQTHTHTYKNIYIHAYR